jgi:hypothetical protein
MRIDLALFESQQSQRRGVVVLPSSLLQLLSPIRMLYVLPNRASFVPGRTWILALSSYRADVAGKAQTALIASVLHLVHSYGVAVAALACVELAFASFACVAMILFIAAYVTGSNSVWLV